MRREDMEGAFRRVRDIRLALAALLALSMAANLALTMSFAGRETVNVLVPATAGPACVRSPPRTCLRAGRHKSWHRPNDVNLCEPM